jgi:hypothetical protein
MLQPLKLTETFILFSFKEKIALIERHEAHIINTPDFFLNFEIKLIENREIQ